jgi:hypothetical protein
MKQLRNLLEICKMPGAPVIHNGRIIVIKTVEMIKFIERMGDKL